MKNSNFQYQHMVHLRAGTTYSLLENAVKVGDLSTLCHKYRCPAIGVAETHNLFSSLELSITLASSGIQHIIGCKLHLYEPEFQPEMKTDDIVLFAKNHMGYKNLVKILSNSYFYQNPNLKEAHISIQQLRQYNEGIICLTASKGGTLYRLLQDNRHESAARFVTILKEIFADRLYIEISRCSEEERRMSSQHIDLAYKYDIPLVATNPINFIKSVSRLHPDGNAHHETLLCLAHGDRYESPHKYSCREHYFKSAREMRQLFADIPEALDNTVVIAQRCSFMLEKKPPLLPKYPDTGHGITESKLLYQNASEGLEILLNKYVYQPSDDHDNRSQIHKQYFDRLNYELDIITKMGFSGYYLIVADFIQWSKKNHIPIGPGRGSGAGSIIAWALNITTVDPIYFGLLFERFLNPERISIPDFDIDFCPEHRDRVIEYVRNKYGKDKVAQIITFGTLQPRAVMRDVARVHNIPMGEIDEICKMIPYNPVNPVSLQESLDADETLRKKCKRDKNISTVTEIALLLENLKRHVSTHAAGVVISDTALTDIVPLYADHNSSIPIIQYSLKHAENAGLVKFDFLGLTTLTVIRKCCDLIEARGKKIDLDNFEDETTFQLLSEGKTVGVFQFEGTGIREAIKQLQPDSIHILLALSALYRPGPLDNIPTYIECRHGRQKPNYLHPKLEVVLKETFGVIIYQEQVLQIAQILAGYSLGQADLLRRAMGKKIKSEMDAQRNIFVSGAISNGIDAEQADYIFDLVAKFAGYGFNKAHAVSYGILSYQTAYLKANYPVEFMTVLLNLDIGDLNKLRLLYEETKKLSISILPVDINKSHAYFNIEETPNGSAIRVGLGALRNVGIHAAETMAQYRNSAFLDLHDFIRRLAPHNAVNKRAIESLITAGAFDTLDDNRQLLYETLHQIWDIEQLSLKDKKRKQNLLFDLSNSDKQNMINHMSKTHKHKSRWTQYDQLLKEHHVIGYYFDTHPITIYQGFLDILQIQYYHSVENMTQESDRKSIKLAAQLIDWKKKPAGYNLLLSDPSAEYEIMVFNKEVGRSISSMKTHFVVMDIEIRIQGLTKRLFVQSIALLDDYLNTLNKKFTISTDDVEVVHKLKQVMNQTEGLGVNLIFNNELGSSIISLPTDLKLHARYIDLFFDKLIYK